MTCTHEDQRYILVIKYSTTENQIISLIIILLGNSDMLRKLNEIRDMQERLTLRHFEIDQMRIRHDRLSY